MDPFSWFVLAVLAIMGLTGAHRRYTRFKLVKFLTEKGKSADEITKIVNSYKGE